MTPAYFESCAKQMKRLKPKTKQIAYRIMVEGESISALAEENNISIQRVGQICRTIMEVGERDPYMYVGDQILKIVNTSKGIKKADLLKIQLLLANLGMIE